MITDERIKRLKNEGYNPIHLFKNVYLVRHYPKPMYRFSIYEIAKFPSIEEIKSVPFEEVKENVEKMLQKENKKNFRKIIFKAKFAEILIKILHKMYKNTIELENFPLLPIQDYNLKEEGK